MMDMNSSMTPREEAADLAWEEYAATVQVMKRAADSSADHRQWRKAHENMIRDGERFKALFLKLDEPTPPDLRVEAARLGAEGTALFVAICAFLSLFLPDLKANFWPLAITFAAVAAIGGWTAHYLGRLGQHIGRRM